jgi:hypothetical protein
VTLGALLILAVNVAIAAPLFAIEYSAYRGSVEGTFLALARVMAKHPGQRQWWPLWNGGLPFEVAYLPFSHWLVAGFSLLTGLSAARAFHIVSASVYVLGSLTLFWLAWELSRRLVPSLIAALVWSCVSICALLMPVIAADAGGALQLRRLQVLVFYAEAPHTLAVTLIPVALVCYSRALARPGAMWKLLAGAVTGCALLTNAFAIVMLPAAVVCWLIAFPVLPWWRRPVIAAAIGLAGCLWVSPWLSPAMIRAMAASAPTNGGDFRYTAASWIALAAAAGLFVLLALVMSRLKAPPYLRFFVLFAYVPTAIVTAHVVWKAAILPQPARYHLEADMALALAVVFMGAIALDRVSPRIRAIAVSAALAALAVQTLHSVAYARGLIRAVDPTTTGEYKVAKWLDANRPGQRAFLSGSSRFQFNAFTDNPQLTGGHDQHTVSRFLPIVEFTIYSDMNAGDRGADYSIFWLKAFGTYLVHVPGPESDDVYKPIVHPCKFDGVLPRVWHEGGNSIYEVPARSTSLAHVIPASAVVTRTPIHGLDTAPAEAYVAALENPAYPLAGFRWKSFSEAGIDAVVNPGQVISVQVTYERGWEAWANGRRQRVRGDALGQLVVEPDRPGPCHIELRYTGGPEHAATRVLSCAVMLLAAAIGYAARSRSSSPSR